MSLSSSVAFPSGSLSCEEMVSESHLELLVNLSQCFQPKCSNLSCKRLKEDIRSLETALRRDISDLDRQDTQTLRLLHEHYISSCESPNCRVPWCRVMSYRDVEAVTDTLQELTQLLNFPMLTLLPHETEFDDFINLNNEVDCEVVEWDQWLTITPMSDFHTVALAAPLNLIDHPDRWVVKMTALQDGDNQLQMLRKLRGLEHPHVIGHVWAASCSIHNVLVICTQYLPGRSVKEVLEEGPGLTYSQSRLFFLQVLHATQWLHQLDIVFLNWKCSNLLLDASEQKVKVSNFSTAVDVSRDNADPGVIKLTMTADIVPPEVLKNKEVNHKTDSWGLACVVYEMLTTVRPWQHLKHDRQDHVWKQIVTQALPAQSCSLPQTVQTLVLRCLQKCPESRLSVEEMIVYLQAELD